MLSKVSESLHTVALSIVRVCYTVGKITDGTHLFAQ